MLTSLELVDYPETLLPTNALRNLTSLRSLTVRYRYIREGIVCRLPSWLSSLHQLKTLSIIGESQRRLLCVDVCSFLLPFIESKRSFMSNAFPGGNSLATYTTTIPPSVSQLTLRVAITLKDMDAIAPKVQTLEHLDIEQNRSSGSLCKRIPMLFPYLKTLRIR